MNTMAAERRRKRSPKQVAQAITIELRREKAMELKRDGWSYRDIAKKLGVSVGTVHTDITDLLDEVNESAHELARKERAAQLDRLDIAIKAIMPKVKKGDGEAILRLERIEKRRADLLGLDAPTRVQTELSGSVSLDDIDELREAARANECSAQTPSPQPPAPPPTSDGSAPSS
jgi:transposase